MEAVRSVIAVLIRLPLLEYFYTNAAFFLERDPMFGVWKAEV